LLQLFGPWHSQQEHWSCADFAPALLLPCVYQTAGVIIVAYACMDLRELALPGGFLLLLLSAAAQLPFFIFLCNYLDGDAAIGMKVGCQASTTLRGGMLYDEPL